MRTGGGKFSEWFGVEQGLYQGCVITLLLLNMFFTVVLHVALANFCNDVDILRNLVQFRNREKG